MNFQLCFYPAQANSGFCMKDYYIRCGSLLHENGLYSLFASRWPKETGFPDGYMMHSEIVLATTDRLDHPFKFEKSILAPRDGGFWDSKMAHNPFIMRIGAEYILFYIGTPDGRGETRTNGAQLLQTEKSS